MGEEWMRPYVEQTFGAGAIVDTLSLDSNAWGLELGLEKVYGVRFPANHAATRVILPDGRRYIMDFWDQIGRSQGTPARLIPEDAWTQQWRGELLGGGTVSRTSYEQALHDEVDAWGEQDGPAHFREQFAKHNITRLTSVQVETMIRSWRASPW
jgi:hypothetical protein